MGACKKHPDNKQLQGVCPFCLRERLSQLNVTPHKNTSMVSPLTYTSISSSSFTSGASSNIEPPVNHRHHRNVSEVCGSISFKVSAGVGLKKSRSMAFFPRNLVGEVKSGNKKKGFWSKLLHLKGEKEVLMQSRAVSRRLY